MKALSATVALLVLGSSVAYAEKSRFARSKNASIWRMRADSTEVRVSTAPQTGA
ncbi:hypothetical protein BN961_01332 [Afipia felis]|uniref:Uncharacterized protein n=1 Tax=Afipia felis TaxID=1035 RepID=A0A090MKI9_AFIFE|nr:hypothetical protein BN961_01332 [Afipia felis]